MAEAKKEFDPVAVRREAVQIGKEMELTGKELSTFVKNAAEAAEFAFKKEKELEQKKFDKEKELELKKLDVAAETERRKLELDHERKMENLKAKKKEEADDHDTPGASSNIFGGFRTPFKLANFDDQQGLR